MPTAVEIGQAVLSGTFIGAAFAVLSVGFSLVWGVTKVINISHSAFALLGSYLAYWFLTRFRIDPLISLVVTLPLLFFLGVGFYRSFVKATVKRTKDITLASVVLTFGLAIIVENLLLYFVKGDVRLVTPSYSGKSWFLGAIALPISQVIGFALAAATISGLHFFVRYTHTGKQVISVWQDREGAMLCGIHVERVTMLAYGLAFAAAGSGGLCMSLIYAFYPSIHTSWLIFLFLVVILGGVGSILGSALSGLIIGLVIALSGTFISFSWMNLVLFLLLIIILLLRPAGLMRR